MHGFKNVEFIFLTFKDLNLQPNSIHQFLRKKLLSLVVVVVSM